jgi:putative RecB family exonuclease
MSIPLPLAPAHVPKAPAPAKPQRDYCSFSAINTYQRCPLKYYFRYVLKLPDETNPASLVFGRSIHAALQHYFEQLLAGADRPDLDGLLDVFQEAWRGHEMPIQFGKREDFDSYCHLADRTLWKFLESDWAYPEGQIIGVEEELRAPIIPGCPDVLGRIDLLVDTGDALELSDFKTSRSSWNDEHVAEAAPQLWLYAELVRPLASSRPVRLAFAVLTKAQSPTFTLHPVEDSPKQVERTKRVVQRVWKAIKAENFYPCPSLMNCSTCPYQKPCQAWTG